MCTAVISFDPLSAVPVLLVGVRDEFVDRSWQPPGNHWPDRPDLVGGRDLRAGGTWLAVDPGARRAACVLNGRGPMAPEASRASRGELPLHVLSEEGKLDGLELERFDPFHLVYAETGAVRLWSWDGVTPAEQELGPGLHLIVNTGLEGGDGTQGLDGDEAGAAAQMSARIDHFRPRLLAATRPEPTSGTTARAWGDWLPLVDGGGLEPSDPRALVLRRDFGTGQLWGTTSVSLVGLTAHDVRYDFSAAPGDARAWTPIRAISESRKM